MDFAQPVSMTLPISETHHLKPLPDLSPLPPQTRQLESTSSIIGIVALCRFSMASDIRLSEARRKELSDALQESKCAWLRRAF